MYSYKNIHVQHSELLNYDLLIASNEYVPKGPKYDMVPKRVATEPYMYQYHHSIFSEF